MITLNVEADFDKIKVNLSIIQFFVLTVHSKDKFPS